MTTYQWAVIGAGPAGIAAVGKLLDDGISAAQIVWIDPYFKVGDFGMLWGNVPSNTKVDAFLQFLQAAKAFSYQRCTQDFSINHLEPDKTCYLRVMAEPLQWVTNHLKQKVQAIVSVAKNLVLKDRFWNIQLNETEIQAKNVILAIGAEPKKLAYPAVTAIPLKDAMDGERLKNHLDAHDTIAVFGSSHSAILVLRNLIESQAKHIINFYRSPLRYAVYLEDWILFDDTGLKGTVAEWARENLNGTCPNNLTRIYCNEENIEHYLLSCNKVIYAVGFERRLLPVIVDLTHVDYVEQCGIIAPGLFGVGIAFPEAKYNPLGMLEYRVGLRKFMEYLQRVMPIWLNYPA